jgi:hypothetical protein
MTMPEYNQPPRSTAITDHLKLIHAGLRDELATLRQSVADYLAGRADGVTVPLPELGDQMRRHCLTFCGHLHGHHDREELTFDELGPKVPDLGPMFDRLRAEHRVVTELNERIAKLVEDLDADALRTELATLTERLEAHFDYEERELAPALDARL